MALKPFESVTHKSNVRHRYHACQFGIDLQLMAACRPNGQVRVGIVVGRKVQPDWQPVAVWEKRFGG